MEKTYKACMIYLVPIKEFNFMVYENTFAYFTVQ